MYSFTGDYIKLFEYLCNYTSKDTIFVYIKTTIHKNK